MTRLTRLTLTLLILNLLALSGCTQSSDNDIVKPNDDLSNQARVYFISPLDGQTVANTFKIRFGLQGMGIAPAGVVKDNTGHHHLLVNLKELPDMSASLPATDQIIHFGGGQTETVLELPPGQHSLQLLLGDFAHRPHANPILSEKITIFVE